METHVQLEHGRKPALLLFAKHATPPVLNVPEIQTSVQYVYMLIMPLQTFTWKGIHALKHVRLEALKILPLLLLLYVVLVLHLVQHVHQMPLPVRNA